MNMVKKIVLFTLMLFPVAVFAQDASKMAYINPLEVITVMPEYKVAADSLQKTREEFQVALQEYQDKFNREYTDLLLKRDSLSEAMYIMKQQEVNGIRERAENYQQYAQQKAEELQTALFTPIYAKFQKAIEAVSKENNFIFVMNNEVFLYTSPNMIDAAPLVKKKLGIQ